MLIEYTDGILDINGQIISNIGQVEFSLGTGKTEAVSIGLSHDVAYYTDISTYVSFVRFTISYSYDSEMLVYDWRSRAQDNLIKLTVSSIDGAVKVFENAFLTNDPVITSGLNSKITVEFCSKSVQ